MLITLWRGRVQLPVAVTSDVAGPPAARTMLLLDQHFRLLVLALVGVYLLLLQLRYIAGLPLVM